MLIGNNLAISNNGEYTQTVMYAKIIKTYMDRVYINLGKVVICREGDKVKAGDLSFRHT